MSDIKGTAEAFFEACETGKGGAACAPYMHAGATFSAQSEPIAEITDLSAYCDWMAGLLGFVPDGRYELKSFAVDPERAKVVVYAVFHGTHTGECGPLPPTGKATSSDYVYEMTFEDGKIRHMTKIWNAPWAMKELGWA